MLRFFRKRKGMSQEALGARIGFSKSQVAMVESGHRPPKGNFTPNADVELGAQGVLLEVAEEEFGDSTVVPPWTEDYLAEEKQASVIYAYQTHVVPGLLQTPEYARAVFNCNYCPPWDDDEIERQVAKRVKRQELFSRKPAPVTSFVLEESILNRPIGGRDVLKRQLHSILEIGRLRHVEVQVVPHGRETHAGLNGPMILLETASRHQLVYVEGQGGGYFVSEQPDVANMFGVYGILRTQAHNSEKSAQIIEKAADAL
ncbi:helix-turn-helix transcriptional regulator [Streptomyces cremeus]|uniref:Helix-turn-helix transcriptional regulator n=1 Tax=Streptomyces cremeus TaxID=66881 RepID=A0ABV5P9P3_STRCM